MKVTKNKKFIISVIVSFFLVSTVLAFSDKTHKALTEKAILGSGTNDYLKEYLGMNQGLSSMLLLDQSTTPEPNRIPTDQLEQRLFPELPANPCTLLEFLKAGAHIEDVPLPRARHHFHAPIANIGVIPPKSK